VVDSTVGCDGIEPMSQPDSHNLRFGEFELGTYRPTSCAEAGSRSTLSANLWTCRSFRERHRQLVWGHDIKAL
jgi:hypothetical protein